VHELVNVVTDHVEARYKHEDYQHIFEKYSNFKFHENPPSGSGVVPC